MLAVAAAVVCTSHTGHDDDDDDDDDDAAAGAGGDGGGGGGNDKPNSKILPLAECACPAFVPPFLLTPGATENCCDELGLNNPDTVGAVPH